MTPDRLSRVSQFNSSYFMKQRNLGHLLLAIYLIVVGVMGLGVAVPIIVTTILALAAGILLLMGK